MNIEIDYEVANEFASNIMIQDYKSLLENDYYEGDREALLAAYRLVMAYSTTEQQRETQGVEL